jgi:hypothetical protein
MLAEASRRAAEARIAKVRWVQARAEELTLDLGSFRVTSFGQSFHWMDRARVARIMIDLLEPGGAFVHVSDVKEPRPTADAGLPYPNPPEPAIRELVRRYLGPLPRAGQGLLRYGTPGDEAAVLSLAGFAGPEYLRVPTAGVRERTTDDVVTWVYSLSSSAPHLFGQRRGEFEADFRRLLDEASRSGQFAEQPPDTVVFIWRTPSR